jgi:hypothetical protein
MSDRASRDTARQTFRQFAWNIAGTLAKTSEGRGQARQSGTGRTTASGSKR